MNVSSIAVFVVGLLAFTAASPSGKVTNKAVGDLISKLRQEVLTSGTEFDPLTFTYYHWMLQSGYYVRVTGGKVETFDIEQSKGLFVASNGEKMVVKVPIAIDRLALEHEIKCLMELGEDGYKVNGTTASSVTAVLQLDVAHASSGTCTGELSSIIVTSTSPAYVLDMSNFEKSVAFDHQCSKATRLDAIKYLGDNLNTNFPSAIVKFLTSHLTTALKDFSLC